MASSIFKTVSILPGEHYSILLRIIRPGHANNDTFEETMNLADYNLGDSSFRMQQYPLRHGNCEMDNAHEELYHNSFPYYVIFPIFGNRSWHISLRVVVQRFRYKISTWPARLIWCPLMTCKSYIQWVYFVRNVLPKRNTTFLFGFWKLLWFWRA